MKKLNMFNLRSLGFYFIFFERLSGILEKMIRTTILKSSKSSSITSGKSEEVKVYFTITC